MALLAGVCGGRDIVCKYKERCTMVKITKLPPGKAKGSEDLQLWSSRRLSGLAGVHEFVGISISKRQESYRMGAERRQRKFDRELEQQIKNREQFDELAKQDDCRRRERFKRKLEASQQLRAKQSASKNK
jgi:hypothetical protein